VAPRRVRNVPSGRDKWIGAGIVAALILSCMGLLRWRLALVALADTHAPDLVSSDQLCRRARRPYRPFHPPLCTLHTSDYACLCGRPMPVRVVPRLVRHLPRAAARRRAGPARPASADLDGRRDIPRSWFRFRVWAPARSAAGLDEAVRVYDLRHAHGLWLLAGGANTEAVKERLGHGSVLTTQRYLHTLPEADDAAVEAFSRVRHRNAR
jgi:hypothetical protein